MELTVIFFVLLLFRRQVDAGCGGAIFRSWEHVFYHQITGKHSYLLDGLVDDFTLLVQGDGGEDVLDCRQGIPVWFFCR